MSSAASLLQDQRSDGALAQLPWFAPGVLRRRAGQRRQMLIVQAASCSLITLILLVYCYAGTIPIIIASAYSCRAWGTIGFSSCSPKPMSATVR